METFGFQCRTRLGGWCNRRSTASRATILRSFNAARGFVGGAATIGEERLAEVRRFNAARGFVGGAAMLTSVPTRLTYSFNAACGFAGGAATFERTFTPVRELFQCRTRLFPFAPTTASRSPSPAHAGEAWLRAVFSQNHAISASPADAGERSTSANHTSFYSCSWDVFPYDLFPVQLCPMGLLLGQVSKWRAQRADRGAHAARGFVGGAAKEVLRILP